MHDRVLYLSRIVSSIADAVVLTEGLPSDWQARKLRQFFAEMSAPHEPHKLILDAAHDVVDAIEDHQDWLAETMPSLINNADVKITIHNAVRLARSVRRLMKGQDGGEELKQVLLERGNDSLRSFLQYMHENAPNIGRKQGAVVRDYIIERIRYYRELGCATRGEIYERICKELAKSDAVLRWQKTTERLERRRLESTMEVQAFIRLEEGKLKRAEGADKLREIEVNARRAHARKQRGGKNISTPPLEQKFYI